MTCNAGEYKTESGCQQCRANTYSEDGAESCIDCPEGTISPAGSGSREECQPGMYLCMLIARSAFRDS